VIIGFLLVCAGLVFYWNILPDPYEYDWMTMTPYFINIRHFSHYCTAIVILGTAFLLGGSKRHLVISGSFLLLSICWAFLFWSGSRAGIGSAALGLLGVGIFSENKKRRIFVVTILSCLAGYLLSETIASENYALGLVNAVKRTDINNLLPGRIELWMFSLKWVKPSFLLGMGADAFRFLPNDNFIVDHPHNIVIQFVLDWGILGACIFVLLQYRLMKIGVRTLLKGDNGWLKGIKVSCFSWIVVSLIFGLVDGIYYFAIPMTLTAYCFAMIFLGRENDPCLNSHDTGTISINRFFLRCTASVLITTLILLINLS